MLDLSPVKYLFSLSITEHVCCFCAPVLWTSSQKHKLSRISASFCSESSVMQSCPLVYGCKNMKVRAEVKCLLVFTVVKHVWWLFLTFGLNPQLICDWQKLPSLVLTHNNQCETVPSHNAQQTWNRTVTQARQMRNRTITQLSTNAKPYRDTTIDQRKTIPSHNSPPTRNHTVTMLDKHKHSTMRCQKVTW